MMLLTSESRSRIDGIGWSERNVFQLYQQVETTFKMHLSTNAQRFFAMPESVGNDQIDYYTSEYSEAKRYTDLSAKAQEQCDSLIEAAVNEIEEFRRSRQESADVNDRDLALALDKTFKIPGKDAIWIVDGQPVVTLWGFGQSGTSLDLRSIKGPAPKTASNVGGDDIKTKRKWWLWLLLLLLLLLGILAYLFGPRLLCEWGYRNCNAPIASDDAATLKLSDNFVDVLVTANDRDPDGDDITIASCSAPGFVVNGKTVRYSRDLGVVAGIVKFSCTVTDPAGNTDTAQVTVTVEPQPIPPSAREVSVFLPESKQSVEVDVKSGIVNGGRETWQVVGCSAPGVLRNGKVFYPRNSNPNVTFERFTCTAQGSKGGILNIPVTAKSANEMARCEPVTKNAPVRLLIGADWSSSMDKDAKFTRMISGLSTVAGQLPKETKATLDLMRGKGAIDLKTQGPAFLSGPFSDRPNPNFENYIQWLSNEIHASGTNYSVITVVTITDARDDPSAFEKSIQNAFSKSRVPVEHILITLGIPSANYGAIYKRMVWPTNETRNHRELNTSSEQQKLASEILQAARVTVREGCE